ncbi:hypothetical protein [Xanthobacter sp. VNH20]|uniref:hypothetical protein n=1 Tax=Xanthobacter sp. VNH20 TaxID=3156616 RepID=UPI0032B34E61
MKDAQKQCFEFDQSAGKGAINSVTHPKIGYGIMNYLGDDALHTAISGEERAEAGAAARQM